MLTKCTPTSVLLVDLSQHGRETRGAIDLDIQCEREHLQIVAAHLGLKPSERRIQVEKLLKHFGSKHCILMGNGWCATAMMSPCFSSAARKASLAVRMSTTSFFSS